MELRESSDTLKEAVKRHLESEDPEYAEAAKRLKTMTADREISKIRKIRKK